MADRKREILICSCEDTMPLDAAAVKNGCRSAKVTTARQLCRAELGTFRAAAGAPLIVGCTQESARPRAGLPTQAPQHPKWPR
jgi:hypothetical protein